MVQETARAAGWAPGREVEAEALDLAARRGQPASLALLREWRQAVLAEIRVCLSA
jgi:hypothetical protein